MKKNDFPDMSHLLGSMPLQMIYNNSKLRRMAADRSNRALIEHRLRTTSEDIRNLTPAARSILSRLHRAFEENGYMSIDRRQIAAILRRPSRSLGTWDRRLLDRLVELKFISMKQRNFPTYRGEDRWHGRGRKFEYEMSLDTGWLLYTLKRQSRRKKTD